MKGLVFVGLNKIEIQERPKPLIVEPTDGIIKLAKTTICGSDLHILKGHVPRVPFGRIMGHEGLGTVDAVGASVTRFKPGDRVIISTMTKCGRCEFCAQGMYSHCADGGWTLGNTVDGTQAEYTRVRHADGSLYLAPPGVDEDALVMASCMLPTGMECGVLSGRVRPGCRVAIVGAGPIGLSALMSAQLYSPSVIIMLDLDPARLEAGRRLGAMHAVLSGPHAVEEVMRITDGKGVDTAIEAVGSPPTFELCQELIGVGGTIANIGIHGGKVDLHMDKLWDRNITITTRMLDTFATGKLLELLKAGKINGKALATHSFHFNDIITAYDTFAAAAANHALKVIVDFENPGRENARL